MPIRHVYTLALPAEPATLRTQHPTGGVLRHPEPAETELLAELMLDAYHNTIDDAGETTDDALVEIEGYFAGKSGKPMLDCSWVYESSGALLSACLVTRHEDAPLIAYLVTRAPWKGRGLASYLLRQSLLSLQDQHCTLVRAVVTEGNAPSEQMLLGFGFKRAG
jgi:GNAT superfamily N-acetyltransferase